MGLRFRTMATMVSAMADQNDPAEFDAYTANYNEEINKALSFSGMDIDFFARVKNDYLVDILDARLGGAGKVELLDVGCGIANAHKQLVGRVGKLSGIDVSSESIAVARQSNPGIRYEVFDGTHLPFADGSFDAAFAVNVFHHVPIAQRSSARRRYPSRAAPGRLVRDIRAQSAQPGDQARGRYLRVRQGRRAAEATRFGSAAARFRLQRYQNQIYLSPCRPPDACFAGSTACFRCCR